MKTEKDISIFLNDEIIEKLWIFMIFKNSIKLVIFNYEKRQSKY